MNRISNSIGAASLVFGLSTSVSIAAPVRLDFELGFEDAFGGFFTQMTGSFYGLDDEVMGFQSASSFDLFGTSINYTGISTANATFNFFNLSSSTEPVFDFLISSDISEPIAEFGGFSELIEVDFRNVTGFSAMPRFSVIERDLIEGVINGSFSEARFSIQPVTTQPPEPIAAVPLPAGALLLLTAVSGLLGLKQRKKAKGR